MGWVPICIDGVRLGNSVQHRCSSNVDFSIHSCSDHETRKCRMFPQYKRTTPCHRQSAIDARGGSFVCWYLNWFFMRVSAEQRRDALVVDDVDDALPEQGSDRELLELREFLLLRQVDRVRADELDDR